MKEGNNNKDNNVDVKEFVKMTFDNGDVRFTSSKYFIDASQGGIKKNEQIKDASICADGTSRLNGEVCP